MLRNGEQLRPLRWIPAFTWGYPVRSHLRFPVEANTAVTNYPSSQSADLVDRTHWRVHEITDRVDYRESNRIMSDPNTGASDTAERLQQWQESLNDRSEFHNPH